MQKNKVKKNWIKPALTSYGDAAKITKGDLDDKKLTYDDGWSNGVVTAGTPDTP